MDKDKNHHVLKAEPGSFRVVGGSANFIANTATIVAESLGSPTTETIIQAPSVTPPGQPGAPPSPPAPRGGSGAGAPPRRTPSPIVLSPYFKMIFLVVVAITLLAGLALIILASLWPSAPNEFQKQAFSAMDFAWKGGLGAIFGLLGGKALR